MTSAQVRRVPWLLRYRTAPRVGTELRKLAIRVTHQHCTVEFHGPVRLGPGFTLDISGDGTLIVGPAVDFRRRFTCEISGSGRVVIGGGTTFTSDCSIQCTTSIEIGERCTFAQNTLIVDGSHRFRDPDRSMNAQGYDYRPITIGDGASVMAKSTVLNDVGAGAFIGANSVVSRPIPAHCLAVGSPARVVEYFGPSDRRPPDLDIDSARDDG
jgi:maltose O-acetyltransferase